jgi:hypothetical protein
MTAYDVPTHEAIGEVLRKPIATDDPMTNVRGALTTAA